MNKSELVEAIAARCECSRREAEESLNAVIDTISEELKRGGSIQLVGFGTFLTSKRNARTGKNPRTGEAIKIAARTVPKFSPGKALRDVVAGGKKGGGAKAPAKAAAKGGAAKGGAAKGGAKGAAKGGAKAGGKKK